MTKTISIYAAQIGLGLIAIAAGAAKLSGTGVMVHHLHAIGLGPGFLLVAGTCEIVAGLCLLLPRGGILGAFLLASVTIGALGMSLGHVASSATAAPAHALTSTAYQSSHDAGASRIQIFRARTEWDI
jgi:uncharacterized membrane protein YphA (DoxX/SURF4 family)